VLLNKVVIAEDDDAIQHMLGAFLGDAGFLCLRARNGRDALRIVRSQQPDLLILDVMMPELDGIEVARRLKADPLCSAVPILMLTSLSAVEDRVQGLEVGADDYLPKPFDVRELVARVRALVRARRRERERDPSTGLPSGAALEAHVEERLRTGKPFALLHVRLDGFPELADRVGFRQADETLGTLGRLLADASRSAAGGAFLAHVGGDDFVLACEPADAEPLAAAALAAFERTHDAAALVAAAAAPDGGAGGGEPGGLTLRVAGVDTSRTPITSVEQMSKALAEAGRGGIGAPVRWA